MAPAAGALAVPVGGVLSSGYGLALGLPRSPVGAVLFLAAVLVVTYYLLTRLIRVPPPPRSYWTPEDGEQDALSASSTASGQDDATYSDWGERSGPPEPDTDEPAPSLSESGDAAPTPPAARTEPPLRIEAVTVNGVYVARGDTSSQVMRAFRPGEGEMTPLIERNDRGEASHVTRTYVVGRQRLTLAFAREEPGGPLRLAEILLIR